MQAPLAVAVEDVEVDVLVVEVDVFVVEVEAVEDVLPVPGWHYRIISFNRQGRYSGH